MNDAARSAMIGRLKKAEASAAGRGLKIVGYRYEVGDDRLQFTFAPLRRPRREPPAEPPRSRRGIAGTAPRPGMLL